MLQKSPPGSLTLGDVHEITLTIWASVVKVISCTFLVSLMILALSGCQQYNPPYNDFKPYRANYLGAPGAGAGVHQNSKEELIKQLQKCDIIYIDYGDTVTFVVPTDRYFLFNSARLNDTCYTGLFDLITLLRSYAHCCPIYVAGFTDNVGSSYSKKMMSQARAETMLTFLWANGIQAQRLISEGYGDKHPVGDNKLIHGSAYNRRVEIQVLKKCPPQAPYTPFK
jgi:outer membrane protein OmpA-like peptidoglycan-associated protein